MHRPRQIAQEPFSRAFKEHALDNLQAKELVRFADGHHLSVIFLPPSEDAADTALVETAVYGASDLVYQGQLRADDPLWDAFGGFVEQRNGPVSKKKTLRDLALFQEWEERILDLEAEGYFQEVERIQMDRFKRVRQLAHSFTEVIQLWMSECSSEQKRALAEPAGATLRLCISRLKEATASSDYPDGITPGELSETQQLLRSVAESDAFTEERSKIEFFATALESLAVFIRDSTHPPIPEKTLPYEPAAADDARSTKFYANIFQLVVRGEEPRKLLNWYLLPPEKLAGYPDDWRIDSLQGLFEKMVAHRSYVPPIPKVSPSGRPPANEPTVTLTETAETKLGSF